MRDAVATKSAPAKSKPVQSRKPGIAPSWPHGRARRARGISVIVPAHNEERYLAQTLASLERQAIPAREVIVVANGCSDGTADVARGHCDRLIVLSQKNLGVARNLGARMARGKLLVFLDADTCLEPDALAVITRQFTRRDAAGTLKGMPDSRRPAYRLIYFLKNFTHRWINRKGSSGVIVCWKKHFVRAGGFDEALEVRENSDLIERLKRFGRYHYIGNTRAITSMRRYDRRGLWRIAWLWIKLCVRSWFGGDLRGRTYESVR